jgi:MtN3 and saliva related transmembrane protein
MDWIMILGLAAGTLTTIAFIPQLLMTWRLKSARNVSFGMLTTFCLGVLLWLIYGLAIEARPIILANAVTLVLALAILALKIKYRD